MKKINNLARNLHYLWVWPALCLVLFMGAIASTTQLAAAVTNCPKGEVAISNGCKNPKDGSVTCDSGYEAQYDGSTLVCQKNGTTQPVQTCADGSKDNGNCPTVNTGDPTGQYSCGGGDNAIKTSINLGCKGQGNPVMDLVFAIVRFLSDGVGLVLVGSMIFAGIQYTSSRGDPQATAAAIGRIRSNITALFVFIFAYAILNYVVPGQLLK